MYIIAAGCFFAGLRLAFRQGYDNSQTENDQWRFPGIASVCDDEHQHAAACGQRPREYVKSDEDSVVSSNAKGLAGRYAGALYDLAVEAKPQTPFFQI